MLIEMFLALLAESENPIISEMDEEILDTVRDEYGINIIPDKNDDISIEIENPKVFCHDSAQAIGIITEYICELSPQMKGITPKVTAISVWTPAPEKLDKAYGKLLVALEPCFSEKFDGINFKGSLSSSINTAFFKIKFSIAKH